MYVTSVVPTGKKAPGDFEEIKDCKSQSVATGSIHVTLLPHCVAEVETLISEGHPVITGGTNPTDAEQQTEPFFLLSAAIM